MRLKCASRCNFQATSRPRKLRSQYVKFFVNRFMRRRNQFDKKFFATCNKSSRSTYKLQKEILGLTNRRRKIPWQSTFERKHFDNAEAIWNRHRPPLTLPFTPKKQAKIHPVIPELNETQWIRLTLIISPTQPPRLSVTKKFGGRSENFRASAFLLTARARNDKLFALSKGG